MEYKSINFKQRVFLHVLSDIFNFQLHSSAHSTWRLDVGRLGYIDTQNLLLNLERCINELEYMDSALYVLLHWAHEAEIPNDPELIELLNSLRSHYPAFIVALRQIKLRKYIESIDDFTDKEVIKKGGDYNPLNTRIDYRFNSNYKRHISKLIWNK